MPDNFTLTQSDISNLKGDSDRIKQFLQAQNFIFFNNGDTSKNQIISGFGNMGMKVWAYALQKKLTKSKHVWAFTPDGYKGGGVVTATISSSDKVTSELGLVCMVYQNGGKLEVHVNAVASGAAKKIASKGHAITINLIVIESA